MTRNIRRYLILALAVLTMVLLGSAAGFYQAINAPVVLESADFEVESGSSFNRVVIRLQEQGLLQHARSFRVWARLRGAENRIKAGVYRLDAGLSGQQLLNKLMAGDVVQYRVTLVEGWTLRQALAAVQASPRIVSQLGVFEPSRIAAALDIEQLNPEGMFFPDTYNYPAGSTDLEILERAHKRMLTVLSASWEDRLGALPFATPYDALILASLVEKETGLASERPEIAGVFVRRLEAGMRLQSDPTVIYGLGDHFTGDLRREDLQVDSPYNTYRNAGLPPTPIAMPGREAIEAVLHPALSSSLYFVARGDGSHYFSSTLEEHNAAVDRFQKHIAQ